MTHVLLWSQRQNALHIEEVEEMLTVNRAAYRDNRAMEYLPLWFGSLDQCQTLAKNLHGTLASRARDQGTESVGDQAQPSETPSSSESVAVASNQSSPIATPTSSFQPGNSP